MFIHCGEPDAAHLQCKAVSGVCSFTAKKHVHITGAVKGKWLSKIAEPYPWIIARFIAHALEHAAHAISVANVSRIVGPAHNDAYGD